MASGQEPENPAKRAACHPRPLGASSGSPAGPCLGAGCVGLSVPPLLGDEHPRRLPGGPGLSQTRRPWPGELRVGVGEGGWGLSDTDTIK